MPWPRYHVTPDGLDTGNFCVLDRKNPLDKKPLCTSASKEDAEHISRLLSMSDELSIDLIESLMKEDIQFVLSNILKNNLPSELSKQSGIPVSTLADWKAKNIPDSVQKVIKLLDSFNMKIIIAKDFGHNNKGKDDE